MKLSKREEELSQATNAGKRAFQNNWDKALQYKIDPAISDAWDNGYKIAKQEAIEEHRIGYF